MKEDLIQLPELSDIKELLAMAKDDIAEQITETPEMKDEGELLKQVMGIIETKIGKEKDLHKLNLNAKIDMAAHLSFLQSLLEEFFMIDDEFDDEFFDEEDEEE